MAFAALCTSFALAHAGEPIDSKAVEPAPAPDQWKLLLAVPGWVAATSGTTGINGLNSHVYIGPDTLVSHLDAAVSLSAELRKGPFGIYSDLLYVGVSDVVSPNGLISGVRIRFDFNAGSPIWS